MSVQTGLLLAALQAQVAERGVVYAKIRGKARNRGLCDKVITPALSLCIQQPLERKL